MRNNQVVPHFEKVNLHFEILKKGDLVKDAFTGLPALIVDTQVVWVDHNGQRHVWDFKVLTKSSVINMDREDCIGEFVPQECNRECGYGMKDEIYNIIQQPGDKGYKCAHKEGKTISNPCLNRLCKSGEFCINDNDCKNNICGEDFRCADIICPSNSVENCNTEDKCESLNNDNSNVLYTWDNNQCNTSFKKYNTNTNTTNTNITNTNTNTTPSQ